MAKPVDVTGKRHGKVIYLFMEKIAQKGAICFVKSKGKGLIWLC